MKKLLSVFMFCFMMLMSLGAICFADGEQNQDQDAIAQWLEPAAGDWYSTKGNFVMSVQDNMINGCQILSSKDCTYDYPRTGTFQVAESTGNRDMKLDLFGNNIHQYLVVDDKMLLRRSEHPEYNESVNGIYLGMTRDDLLQHYTQPASTTVDNGVECRAYTADKMNVYLTHDIVIAIRLYKDSSRHFDKSGLSAADTPAAYAQAYGLSETPVIPTSTGAISPAYKAGHGEFLFFGPDYVDLSVYRS